MSTTTNNNDAAIYTLDLPTNLEFLNDDDVLTVYLFKNGEQMDGKSVFKSELQDNLLDQFSKIFGVFIEAFEDR